MFYGSAGTAKDVGAPSAGTQINRNASGGYVATVGASTFTLVSQNPDFNRLSFRSNLVMRWEWARGSTFFLIWQQNRVGSMPVGSIVRPGSLWDATTTDGDNFFAIKISYWIAAR
jgi:hypothetical protein